MLNNGKNLLGNKACELRELEQFLGEVGSSINDMSSTLI